MRHGLELGALDPALVAALVGAYDAVRPLAEDEREPGRRCCARPRCASGFRGCTTCTCRARANSSTRTIPRTSSAFCAIARDSLPACRHASGRPDEHVPREFVFNRYPARQGMVWLASAFAMFRQQRLAWVVLLLAYYLALLMLRAIPFLGPTR